MIGPNNVVVQITDLTTVILIPLGGKRAAPDSTFSDVAARARMLLKRGRRFAQPGDVMSAHAALATSAGCSAREPIARRFQALIMAMTIDRSAISFSENCRRALL